MLSSTGLLARLDARDAGLSAETSGPRARHDVVISRIRTTAHSDFGIITSHGRLLRCRALDLPSVPRSNVSPSLQGGSRVQEIVSLGSGEQVLALTTLDEDASLGLALGTRSGVVKRVRPEVLTKEEWSLIDLEPGDVLVGALELTRAEDELVFISTDAQLLHFPAESVRPQGRTGKGIAGIKLVAGQQALWFGAAPLADSVVVTVAGSLDALPGTQSGSVKATVFQEYPAKGRATGGVRCHRFLKGEDTLLLGWAGPIPAVAAGTSGSPVTLPPATGRRDGSGTPVDQPIAAVASARLG